MGLVTWSPGAMPLKVTSAVVGAVLIVTVPVVKALPPTDAVLVNTARTPSVVSAANAARTTIVAAIFLAIDARPLATAHGSSSVILRAFPPPGLLGGLSAAFRNLDCCRLLV